MTAAAIVSDLWSTGTSIRLTEDGLSLAVPAGKLTPAQRERIREHKPELVAFLHAAQETTDQLLAAAMLACEHYKDGPQARQDMRQQCLEVPLDQRAGLRDYFLGKYGVAGDRGE